MGLAHFDKARGFYQDHNWPQALRYSDLAATKLKQMKDRPIEALSDALCMKCDALDFMGQHREQLECAKEWYCLWNTKPTDTGAIKAAFALINSCINNEEYSDAVLYASTLWEIINHKHDNKIPEDERQPYIAEGAYLLAQATLHLAMAEGIPPEEKLNAGQEAIALARRALEIHTQLYGTEDDKVANGMSLLADALGHFGGDDDDEVLRLHEQAIAIYTRVYGSSSLSVAVGKYNLGAVFFNRAKRPPDANDFHRCVANLELALSHYHEAARIYRAIGHVDKAVEVTQFAAKVEEQLLIVTRAAAAATRG